MEHELQFMVDFTLPAELPEEFFDLIPYQRAVVEQYFSEGRLFHYALSLESAKLWAVFNANSEMEVMDLLINLPLTQFMQVEISILTFCSSPDQVAPRFSMN